MTNSHGVSDYPYSTFNTDSSKDERPANHHPSNQRDDDDDIPKSVLFTDQFLIGFVDRANRAFHLVHTPACTDDCEYHSPILESDFSYLGGGDVDPGPYAADTIISGTLKAQPQYLLRYLRKSLENRLAEGQVEPRVEPTLPAFRTAQPPPPPKSETPEPPQPFDYVSSDPAVTRIWDAALTELQQQVARPAFETWLKDTAGVSHSEGEFVVGTANAFVSEMLEHRMYPLIERAVEHVVGEPITVRFQVVMQAAS